MGAVAGSLGALHDLAPSAVCVLAMMGEGELLTEDGRRGNGPALQAAGSRPSQLEAKEGLSLLNGAHSMAAIGYMLVAERRGVSTTCA